MRLTALQQWVFDNLEQVISDGAGWDARYELDGKNVSHQMRGLRDQGIVVIDENGRLSRRPPIRQQPPTINQAVIRDMRALLLDESAAASGDVSAAPDASTGGLSS